MVRISVAAVVFAKLGDRVEVPFADRELHRQTNFNVQNARLNNLFISRHMSLNDAFF